MSHFRLNASVVTSAQRTGRLDLHGRALFTVPTDVFHKDIVTHLTTLDLSENNLTVLPGEIARLVNVRELYLHSNKLRDLPIELLELPNLKSISLENNPNLDPELKALYAKAQPIFKSPGRDAIPILGWLANKVVLPPANNNGAGGSNYYDHQSQPLSPVSPLSGGGKGGFERDYDYDDRRDDRRDEGARRQPSYPTSPQNGPAPVSSQQQQDEDDYMYAQMRARAAARAAAEEADRNAPPPQQQARGGGYDRRDDRDYDEQRGRDSRRDSFSNVGGRDGANENQRNQPPPPVVQQQQAPAPLNRFASNSRGGGVKESPFARDDSIRMERREDVNARDRAVVRGAGNNVVAGLPPASSQDEPRYGRRAYAPASANVGAPFGLDHPTGGNASAASVAHSRGNSSAGKAPFGTDFNRENVVARRVGQTNVSSLVSPFASDDGNKNDASDIRRGVRMVRGNEAVKSSPFGTLPPELAGAHYQTSSGMAASHVQAAVKLRAQGGVDIPSGPASPRRANVGPFDDGQISGNGPRNQGGVRQSSRPNSDIFHRDEPREEFRREPPPQRELPPRPYGRDRDDSPPRGGDDRSYQQARPLSQQRRDDSRYGGAAGEEASRRTDDRSNSRAAAGAAITGQSSSQRGSTPTRASGSGRNSSAAFSAPFARDHDAPPPPVAGGRFRGENKINQSSLIGSRFGDDGSTEAPRQSRGGPNRPVKDTRLW